MHIPSLIIKRADFSTPSKHPYILFSLPSRHPIFPQSHLHLPCFSLLFRGRHPEHDHSKDKEHGYRAYTDIRLAGHLRDQADYGCAKEGCTFSAYVHQTEIFAGFFRWDDLGEIRPGQRLNPALEHANQNRQNPKLPLLPQEDSEYGNAKVCSNTDCDESFCFITIG